MAVCTTCRKVKGGYLLHHKNRLLRCRQWREEWVVLYEDSTLAWYKEKGQRVPDGSLVIADAPELLAASKWTQRIPGRPSLPDGCKHSQLLAVATRRSAQSHKVHWLLAQNEHEVNDWMLAISRTLPPLGPPKEPQWGSQSTHKNNPKHRNKDKNQHQPWNANDYPLAFMVGATMDWGGWGNGMGWAITHGSQAGYAVDADLSNGNGMDAASSCLARCCTEFECTSELTHGADVIGGLDLDLDFSL